VNKLSHNCTNNGFFGAVAENDGNDIAKEFV